MTTLAPGGPARGRGLRFRLAGFPVRIDVSFWLIAALLGFGRLSVPDIGIWLAVTWVVVVLVSILLHELGHAVAFRAFGVPSDITLHAMGGATAPHGHGALPPGRDFAVSVAGPFTGLALGGIVVVVRGLIDPPTTLAGVVGAQVLNDLVFTNVWWSALNLLPILPLDGGRSMAAVLRALRPRDWARPAYVVSIAFGLAGVALAFVTQRLFVAFLALFFTMSNWTSFQALRRGRGVPADGAGDGPARDDPARPSPAELSAAGPEARAEKSAALLAADRAEDALELARQAWLLGRHPQVALAAARACARLGQPESAVRWLEAAVGAGLEDVGRLRLDPHLARLAGDPAFEALVDRS